MQLNHHQTHHLKDQIKRILSLYVLDVLDSFYFSLYLEQFGGAIIGELPESSQVSPTKTIVTPTPTKTYAIINLCINDPESAEYWIGDTVNVWKTPERKYLKIVGKLPADKNVRVEIIDEKILDEGYVSCKIKSDEYHVEGWIGKHMLILENDENHMMASKKI